MKKKIKFHERILANLNAELHYAHIKGDRERIEYLELQIKKQKELIDDHLQNHK